MPSTRTIVGLDFGMTNSLLTYYDLRTGPTPYRSKWTETIGVRTAIAYPKKSLFERILGSIAQGIVGSRENFKGKIPRAGSTPSERKRNPDYEAAKSFIEALIHEYRESNDNVELEAIVMTIPETWVSGGEQAGRDAFLQLFAELRLPIPYFLSEPVAAACYFAYRHFEDTSNYFDGHVLVYDHGGGTLDISVARVNGFRIHTISNIGLSREMFDRGFGGVAFDDLVLTRLSRQSERREALAQLRGKERYKWLSDFEMLKRRHSPLIEQKCVSTRNSNNKDDPGIFSVGDVEVTLSDLTDTFKTHFAGAIKGQLKAVLSHAKRIDDFDINDPRTFRVIAVGGFSEFYPVQSLLEEFCESECGTREVLKSHMNRDDKWLAISKGACLVAAGKIIVTPTCPFTFGVVSYLGARRHYVELMTLGSPQADYGESHLVDTRFELGKLSPEGGSSIVFYMERAGRKIDLLMTAQFAEVLPDFARAKWWQLGCIVDDGSVRVNIRSDTGRLKNIRIGKLLSMLEGTFEEVFAN